VLSCAQIRNIQYSGFVFFLACSFFFAVSSFAFVVLRTDSQKFFVRIFRTDSQNSVYRNYN
jgi:hypothetical protein